MTSHESLPSSGSYRSSRRRVQQQRQRQPRRRKRSRAAAATVATCCVSAAAILLLSDHININTTHRLKARRSLQQRDTTTDQTENLPELRFDWSHLPPQTELGKRIVASQRCTDGSTTCCPQLRKHRMYNFEVGIGSSLHQWSLALCNAMEEGQIFSTEGVWITYEPWVWLDMDVCPEEARRNPLRCWFGKHVEVPEGICSEDDTAEEDTQAEEVEEVVEEPPIDENDIRGPAYVQAKKRLRDAKKAAAEVVVKAQEANGGEKGELWDIWKQQQNEKEWVIPWTGFEQDKKYWSCPSIISSDQKVGQGGGGFQVQDWYSSAMEFLFSAVEPIVIDEARRQLAKLFPSGDVPHPDDLITVHIRYGDKAREMELVPIEKYVEATHTMVDDRPESRRGLPVYIYIETVDPEAIQLFRDNAPPEWNIVSTGPTYEDISTGPSYDKDSIETTGALAEANTGLATIASILVSLQANRFVLTTTSNWSSLINELRKSVVESRCPVDDSHVNRSCTNMVDLRPGVFPPQDWFNCGAPVSACPF